MSPEPKAPPDLGEITISGDDVAALHPSLIAAPDPPAGAYLRTFCAACLAPTGRATFGAGVEWVVVVRCSKCGRCRAWMSDPEALSAGVAVAALPTIRRKVPR